MVIVDFKNSFRKPDTVAFIDAENFGKASRLPAFRQTISNYGRRFSLLVYGVPKSVRSEFEQFGCTVLSEVQPSQHKNFVDQQITVDALDLAIRYKSIKTIVIASGDADFVPLVMKLKSYEKCIVQIGGGAAVSQRLIESVDHSHRIGRREQGEAFLRSHWPALIIRKAIELLRSRYSSMGVTLAELGNAMKADFAFSPYREFGLKWKELCSCLVPSYGLVLNTRNGVDYIQQSVKARGGDPFTRMGLQNVEN